MLTYFFFNFNIWCLSLQYLRASSVCTWGIGGGARGWSSRWTRAVNDTEGSQHFSLQNTYNSFYFQKCPVLAIFYVTISDLVIYMWILIFAMWSHADQITRPTDSLRFKNSLATSFTKVTEQPLKTIPSKSWKLP